jgi:hypothetical protein
VILVIGALAGRSGARIDSDAVISISPSTGVEILISDSRALKGAQQATQRQVCPVAHRPLMPLTECLAVLVVWFVDAGNVGLAAGVSLVGDER